MATLDDDDRRYLEALIQPLRDNDERYGKTLYGNGQPGLVATVAAQAEAIDTIKTDRRKTLFQSGGIATLVTTLAAVAIKFFTGSL